MINVIGICGRAGAGKDTVGDWLVKNRGFKRISFATPIYAALEAIGFPAPATREEKEAKIEGFDFSWREAAQTLGTEWGRGLDKNLWLKIVEAKIATGHFVITDVRFENEAQMIRKQGAIIHVGGRHSDLGERSSHVSEMPVMYYPGTDYVINNSGTMEELYTELTRDF